MFVLIEEMWRCWDASDQRIRMYKRWKISKFGYPCPPYRQLYWPIWRGTKTYDFPPPIAKFVNTQYQDVESLYHLWYFKMPPKKATEDVKSNVVAFGRVRKNLKMGCVGLPNVGKSSLFNLLTKQSAAAENYPFCTIESNEARCIVPDARYVGFLLFPPVKVSAPLHPFLADITNFTTWSTATDK